MTETVSTEEPWQVKEAIVVIPFLASSLAITYDVGYFYGIDIRLFSLFSFTEHIGFALEALPSAIFFTIVFYQSGVVAKELKKSFLEWPSRNRRVYSYVWWTALGAWFVSSIYVGLVALTFTAVIAVLTVRSLRAMKSGREKALIYAGLIIFATFATGFDRGRVYLRSEKTTHWLQVENETLPVKIVRSGDKGILYMDVKSNQLLFARWDAVKKLGKQLSNPSYLRWLLQPS